MKDCCLSEKITYATVFLRVNQMKYDILTCIEKHNRHFFLRMAVSSKQK